MAHRSRDVSLALSGLELAAPESLKRCEAIREKLSTGNIDEWRGRFILATHDLFDTKLLKQLSQAESVDALSGVIVLTLIRSVRRGSEATAYKRATLRLDELLQMEMFPCDALTLSLLSSKNSKQQTV